MKKTEFSYLCLANCMISTMLRLMRVHGVPETKQLEIVRQICELAGAKPAGSHPGEVYSEVFLMLRRETGIDDPCAEMKKEENAQGVAVLPVIREILDEVPDRLRAACKASAAGNLIDVSFGNSFEAETEIREKMQTPFAVDETETLMQTLREARTVMLLADNAGEIVLDRLLLDEVIRWKAENGYPGAEYEVVIKAEPILNDAMEADARYAGIDKIATISNNGCPRIGTPYEAIPSDVRERLDTADVIIAKGLANFEALCHIDSLSARIFFLLKAKCTIVAGHIGAPVGGLICMQGRKGT